jgi:membrane-associated phospholipid phosphatase
MFALAAALRTSSPELGIFRFAGYPFAATMGFLMWYGDHHWASDVLSGALIGEAFGASAGRAWTPAAPEEITWTLIPAPGGGAVSVQGTF